MIWSVADSARQAPQPQAEGCRSNARARETPRARAAAAGPGAHPGVDCGPEPSLDFEEVHLAAQIQGEPEENNAWLPIGTGGHDVRPLAGAGRANRCLVSESLSGDLLTE